MEEETMKGRDKEGNRRKEKQIRNEGIKNRIESEENTAKREKEKRRSGTERKRQRRLSGPGGGGSDLLLKRSAQLQLGRPDDGHPALPCPYQRA
ncbi:hypothetical protein Pcinc_042225 [Petrolisthes cinctipes]|uniref:Uncharacterized protein n=1 Tax=Petrolisthes cinctipes TaxID=88211 RepID=A0AAE1EJ20_PETCI|nr:hypothetical protein Pcinc_042225 [Petrolisthes cinctipes]